MDKLVETLGITALSKSQVLLKPLAVALSGDELVGWARDRRCKLPQPVRHLRDRLWYNISQIAADIAEVRRACLNAVVVNVPSGPSLA
jgi:hypothetical protein